MTEVADKFAPPESGLPAPRHWPRLAGLSLRAVGELVLARIVFARITVPQILAGNRLAITASDPPGDPVLVSWLAYTVPRVARRMPFRSDCLVQALAAQRWLTSHRIASEIVIGAERPADKPFAAHAWLVCGGVVVTGGDVSQYTVLTQEGEDARGLLGEQRIN